MSDHKGAAMIFPVLPDADVLIGDKGYDSDAFRTALTERKITPESRYTTTLAIAILW